MASGIEWFRLWHDMPNDPKWRTIARASGQPVAVVLAVALHLMADASRNVTRGHVSVTPEDVASAIDVTDDAVEAIFSAMQGRIMDGDVLTGWAKRQPKREEYGDAETGGAKTAAQRKREQRLREKEATPKSDESRDVTAESRDVTQCHEKSRLEKSREEKSINTITSPSIEGEGSSPAAPPTDPPPDLPGIEPHPASAPQAAIPACPHTDILALWAKALPELPQPVKWTEARAQALRCRWREEAAAYRWTTVEEGVGFFEKLFRYCRQSDFLMGRAPLGAGRSTPFLLTLPWLLKAENWAKVQEEKFHRGARP